MFYNRSMKSDSLTKFEKLRISPRYWLLGLAEHDERYYSVLDAMEYGLEHHCGVRNGGDPEFIHQLMIFHHIRTFHKVLRNPHTVYKLIFLHDAVEDPRTDASTGEKVFVSLEEVARRWGPELANKLRLISKEILGVKNPDYSLDTIFADEDLSVVKSGDRVNNVSTMFGVFKPARLERYVKETIEQFLDRIKSARRKFPHQEAIYENAKMELVNQLTLINHIMSTTNELGTSVSANSTAS